MATPADLTKALAEAGITVNGSAPADIKIHDDRLFKRVLSQGTLGLGESYMDGWWDVEALDEFVNKALSAQLQKKVQLNPWQLLVAARGVLLNQQRRGKAFEIGERHYDAGNDLYQAMLDKRLTYTCAYWDTATNLDAAQEAKLDLVCRKLNLQPGQRVLDIGCGWGSWLKYAAEKYGVTGVGITVSKEQVALGQQLCQGLPIDIRLQDYREVSGQFDRVVSLGMFEHVGNKNYRTFMEVVDRNLKPDGLWLLHTIGSNVSTYFSDPWITKYIFPNSMLPSVAQISKATERLFVMEDWHNFGSHYDKTLMSWFANFDRHWPELRSKYGDRFYRMWRFYLLSCAGAFRARHIQLWQIVFSKYGVPGGYKSIR